MEANPYAPPKAEILNELTDAERIRMEHIKTESSIKTAGILYYLGGFFIALMALSGVSSNPRDQIAVIIAWGVAALCFAIGRGLRKLRRWVRVPTIIFSCIGLLWVPFGTLINGIILVNLVSKKATRVLAPEYQEIIAATPHVKQRTSKAALMVLIVLLGVLAWVGFLAWRSSLN